MRDHLKTLTLTLFLILLGAKLCAASWMLEGYILNSPYSDTQVYFSQLSVTLEPHETLQAVVSLPVQYSASPKMQQRQLIHPRLALAWSVPLDGVVSSSVRLDYHLKPQKLQLQGGVQLLCDPLALRCALSYQEQTMALEGSLVFAVNERWALGAHLHYARNSWLTYEIHHTSKQGKQRQLNYSHSLDGSLQRLGLKIAF